jgi:hypothetical protein
MAFLEQYERRPFTVADIGSLKPAGLYLGKGPNAVEIAAFESNTRPTVTALRNTWKARLTGRATPLVVVALYDSKAALCGPAGEQPPAYTDIELGRAERICATALEEPDRHAALRFLTAALPELEQQTSGLRNQGFFASHELTAGVPKRSDWNAATLKAKPLLRRRDRELLQALGFAVESLPGQALVLRAAESRVALAILLERNESPDVASSRFSNTSPISYALAKAEAENLEYVVVLAGPVLRLYPVRTGVGTGQRGRSETFVEIHLDLLPEELAGYLWLLFSATALSKTGPIKEILENSSRYAADLGTRLRDRIYAEVIPSLAQGLIVARKLQRPTASDLIETYQMTLIVLFRLLFIAYAEDKELLPYKSNDLYRARSLKQKANDLTKLKQFGDATTSHWEEVERLFRAVDRGNPEWGVPQYNGGLFSSDATVSKIGAAIAELRLPDRVFGPVLASLLVDRTPEGPGPVDFRSLGVREFGTIYEGLLENELAIAETNLTTETKDKEEHYRPARPEEEVVVSKGQPFLHNTSGARKSTGSYFTKHFTVEHLLEHSVEPALKEHIERLSKMNDREASESFFDFRIADIAMGSGHFLVAAVDRVERVLSSYLADRPLPDVGEELRRLRETAIQAALASGAHLEVENSQLLRRQIARRCIYGVDLNPIAVELARLALWIHTFVPGLPLSFLDHSLVVGNALVGIATIEEARDRLREILDQPLFEFSSKALIGQSTESLSRLARLSDANAQEIDAARAAFRGAKQAVEPAAALFDVLAASRMDAEIEEQVFKEAMNWQFDKELRVDSSFRDKALNKLRAIRPFHFPIAFPEVFLRSRAGFDVIVGNPPWEKVRVEEHEFWARHAPGLRGLNKAQRDKLIEQLRQGRPDLITLWEHERAASEELRDALRFLPGMNTGHPDLFRAFIWRFIQLVWQDGGRMGVVLPGDAFKIAGGSDVRERLAAASFDLAPQMLTNKGGWVFDDVHAQKLIALVTAKVARNKSDTIFHLTPEFHDRASWDRRDPSDELKVPLSTLREFSSSLVLPLLPTTSAFEVVRAFMKFPRLANHPTLRVRRVYADFETSKSDKKYWHPKRGKGDWVVYAGESFDIWTPDTGSYYAFTNAETIQKAAQKKWERAPSNSPYSGLPKPWREHFKNHPLNTPRIAFRDVTNRTNTRTLVASLIPPNVITVQTAPWILWLDPRHDIAEEAYLLGLMSSLPLDWWCRRFIEGHADQEAFNCLRIPEPNSHPRLSKRIVALAGRLAGSDSRLAKWTQAVGVEHGKLEDTDRTNMIQELDAVVAHLYGLTESQLRHIFETYHEHWDYEEQLNETIGHFQTWKTHL